MERDRAAVQIGGEAREQDRAGIDPVAARAASRRPRPAWCSAPPSAASRAARGGRNRASSRSARTPPHRAASKAPGIAAVDEHQARHPSAGSRASRPGGGATLISGSWNAASASGRRLVYFQASSRGPAGRRRETLGRRGAGVALAGQAVAQALEARKERVRGGGDGGGGDGGVHAASATTCA